MKHAASIFALAILIGGSAFFVFHRDAEAQLPGNPSFSSNISRGLDIWRVSGDLSAIRTWLDNGPLEDDDGFRQRLRTDMQSIVKLLGKPQTHSNIQTIDLSPNTKLVYMCVHHEKGPLFMRFVNYRVDGKWLISEIKYNIEVDPLLTPLLN